MTQAALSAACLIPVAAGTVGVDLSLIRPENHTGIVTVEILSVIVFSLLALSRLAGPDQGRAP